MYLHPTSRERWCTFPTAARSKYLPTPAPESFVNAGLEVLNTAEIIVLSPINIYAHP
jgi:hypothetical protein